MNEIMKKNAVKYGIISGVVGIVFTTIIYSIDFKLFANLWLGFGVLMAYLLIGCILLSATKKENNGSLNFKEAFSTYFLSAVIGIAISSLFNILLFNIVDPTAPEQIKTILIDSQIQMLENYDVPREQMKESIKAMKEAEPQFSTLGILKSLVWSFLGSAIFGLILSAIFKSKSNTLNN
jgi:hypothetical protein